MPQYNKGLLSHPNLYPKKTVYLGQTKKKTPSQKVTFPIFKKNITKMVGNSKKQNYNNKNKNRFWIKVGCQLKIIKVFATLKSYQQTKFCYFLRLGKCQNYSATVNHLI